MDANNDAPNNQKPQFPELIDYEVFVPRQALSRNPNGKRKVRLVVRQWLIPPSGLTPPTAKEADQKTIKDTGEPGIQSFIHLVNDSQTCEELSVPRTAGNDVSVNEEAEEPAEFGVFLTTTGCK